jgi:hypothetical protein
MQGAAAEPACRLQELPYEIVQQANCHSAFSCSRLKRCWLPGAVHLSRHLRALFTTGEQSRLHTKQCEKSQACAKACGSGHICGPTANLLS